MQLSVIIVNYNVKYFLEQCLLSVEKAVQQLQAEIWVVDNASTDGSRAYLEPKFPQVQFCWNKENIGFGRACNQALAQATGEYILFLNPDTIVPEDCFTACINFCKQTTDAGALGIRMLDGSGRFLPESKRSFPSPLTSFYKLSGLAALFPKSKTFSRYHLGYLDEHKNHVVDVLAGAFMFIPKAVLDKTGGFDESFFMYGEDVDLSYRIQEAGYKNYYFSERSILHFKGESTKKTSVNYVRMFYDAMSRFVKKHYSSSSAGLFATFISAAIWMRAFLSLIKRFIQRVGLPLLDALLIVASFVLAKYVWTQFIRPEIVYQNKLLWLSFIGFSGLFLVVSYYTGLYDKQFRYKNLFQSSLISLLIILAVYSLMPEEYRFSRGMVLLGSLFSYMLLYVWRQALLKTAVVEKAIDEEDYFSIIAGTQADLQKINQLLQQNGRSKTIQGFVSPLAEQQALGSLTELPQLLQNTPANELVLCESAHLSFAEIIAMYEQAGKKVKLRLHANGSESIIGSDSKNEAGEVLHSQQYQLASAINLRLKRLIDISTALLFLLSFPVHFITNRQPLGLLKQSFAVLIGTKTWIGYSTLRKQLPTLRPSVLGPAGMPHHASKLKKEGLLMADEWYAKEYEPQYDLATIFTNYQKLGNK
ncbi:GT2 family glycosyltransferase [Lacibacter cauensis]|uniref:GT2 family glycosyltransferase n=1 Tax=Lacibacter cauensis TaxID=510947 RepID=A0A562SKL1_9BACT|nr:glycosyltransferase [Lacibacter cauensis]TWI81643.1 GT2 family glycosyltransferase [Lacibacter cauensis]